MNVSDKCRDIHHLTQNFAVSSIDVTEGTTKKRMNIRTTYERYEENFIPSARKATKKISFLKVGVIIESDARTTDVQFNSEA